MGQIIPTFGRRRKSQRECEIYSKDNSQDSIKEEISIPQHTPTYFNCMPLELLDTILQKSYLHSVLRDKKSRDQRDRDVIEGLASVSFCWFQRIRRRRFKKANFAHLSKFYRRVCKLQAVIRSNERYLLENIRPTIDLLENLKSSNCLTKEQIDCIAKLSKDRDRVREILFFLRPLNENKYNALIRSLKRTGQLRVAEIMDNGGAAIRIDIKFWNSKRTEWKQQFVNRINELKDKNIYRSFETEKLIVKLKDDEMEILNSTDDRGVVVWILCKSSEAVEKLKMMNETKALVELFCRITRENPELIEHMSLIIDNDQLEKEIVVFVPMIFDFYATLDISETHKYEDDDWIPDTVDMVRGITKLQNKIYVLCARRFHSIFISTIKVFSDRIPFSLEEKINLESPFDDRIDRGRIIFIDIVSSEKESAIYLLLALTFVWKRTKQNFIEWLRFENDFNPETLSMTNDGQLLMVSGFRPPSLRLYASDAKLYLSIPLHPDITKPQHAVEASTGNFVISHYEQHEDKILLMISVMSRDGKAIISKLNLENVVNVLGIYNFAYFCIDSYDQVFVADTNTTNAILLDLNLRQKQILIRTKEEQKRKYKQRIRRSPRRCYYDEEERQFIVSVRREVDVFALRRQCFVNL